MVRFGTNFNENLIKMQNFIHGNSSENIVCEMVAIFPRGDELSLQPEDQCGVSEVTVTGSHENDFCALWLLTHSPLRDEDVVQRV